MIFSQSRTRRHKGSGINVTSAVVGRRFAGIDIGTTVYTAESKIALGVGSRQKRAKTVAALENAIAKMIGEDFDDYPIERMEIIKVNHPDRIELEVRIRESGNNDSHRSFDA